MNPWVALPLLTSEPDWDGDNAVVIPRERWDAARSIHSPMVTFLGSSACVSPCGDGSIHLEWVVSPKTEPRVALTLELDARDRLTWTLRKFTANPEGGTRHVQTQWGQVDGDVVGCVMRVLESRGIQVHGRVA